MEFFVWLLATVLGVIALVSAKDAKRRATSAEDETQHLRIALENLGKRVAELRKMVQEPRAEPVAPAPAPPPPPEPEPVPESVPVPIPEPVFVAPEPEPVPVPEPVVIEPPPPPPPPPPITPPKPAAPAFDWESFIGVKLFGRSPASRSCSRRSSSSNTPSSTAGCVRRCVQRSASSPARY